MKEVKLYMGGIVYDLSSLKKRIPPKKEQEFKKDVIEGLTRRTLCKKYNVGTKAFYRELQRLLGCNSLIEIRDKY